MIRKIAAYASKLQEREYGVAPPIAGAVNYLLDSWLAKMDERNKPVEYEYIPADPSAHIKELWLGCEIHKCVTVNRSYPSFGKAGNAYAFAMLFSPFGGDMASYKIVPFLDNYKFKESLKGSYEWRVQQETISLSLEQRATLPVYGTFFVESAKSRLVVKIDLCYEGMACIFTVMAAPGQAGAAEEFLADLESSRAANDIYHLKCLSFVRGKLDFSAVTKSSWGQIVLKPQLKDTIRQNTVGILKNAENLAELGMTPNQNVMLISPPGMAKTTIFRAITGEIAGENTVIWCTGKSIDQSQDVTSLFEAARSLAPCIVFIEDMDLFGRDRSSGLYGSDNHVLNEFLACLDGAQENHGVVVMASTNDIDSMDEALVNRPGRFDIKIEIPLPDDSDRFVMLRAFLAGFKAQPDASVTVETWKNVVGLTDGLTGAYIKLLAKSAVIRAVSLGRREADHVVVDSDDLIFAAEQAVANYKIGKRAKRHFVHEDKTAA